jgi:hypothetical protein
MYKSLRDVVSEMYRPKPSLLDEDIFTEYTFNSEGRELIILEKRTPEFIEIEQKTQKIVQDFAAASNGMLKTFDVKSKYSYSFIKREGARFELTEAGREQPKEFFNFDFVKQTAEKIGAKIDDTIGVPADARQRLQKVQGKEFSKSSKFNTYYITRDGVEVPIVMSVNFNKGINFEVLTFEDFNYQMQNGLQEGGLLQSLFQRMNIKPQDYSNIVIDRTHGKAERRPISHIAAALEDVGKRIADLTFVNTKSKQEYYISLKDVKGVTFGQKGISGVFQQKREKDPTTNIEKYTFTNGPRTDLDDFFASIGPLDIIKSRITVGLEEYSNSLFDETAYTKTKYLEENVKASPQFKEYIINLLKSGLGYGYYYVKEKDSKTYIYIDLTTKDKLDKFARDNIQISSLTLQFPYRIGPGEKQGSKTFSIKVNTANGGVYKIEFRSKDPNNVTPTELVLSVGKFETNNKEENFISIVPSKFMVAKLATAAAAIASKNKKKSK